jgi:large subunit ribosomal protein L25
MERVTLEVEARTPGKTSAARALRRSGKIPGILYGTGRTPEPIAVDSRRLREAVTGAGGRHSILDIVTPDAGRKVPVILKEFQTDPVRGILTHIDLLEIRMDRPIDSAASVTLVGEPEGVRLAGGVLDQPTVEIAVHGLPGALPDHIDVDVSGLGIGDSVRVGDLTPPEGVTYTTDADTVIASVTGVTELDLEEPEEAEATTEGAPPDAAAPSDETE